MAPVNMTTSVSSVILLVAFLSTPHTSAYSDYSTKCSQDSPCMGVQSWSKDDISGNGVVSYTTSQENEDRLTKRVTSFEESDNGGWQKIKLDPSVTYQKIQGFGGALTDAAAITINTLNPEMQTKLLENYYSAEGIEYTVGRVPIASCDFSTGVYSYDETENDFELNDFSIAVDSTEITGNKLNLIKTVLEMTVNKISLFASPWAPPAWMTQTNSTVGNPSLRDEPEVYQSWALYFSKFFEAYRDEGVDFWAVTLESTDPDLKIMMHDDQRVHLPTWTSTILDDKDANKYIDGIGLHWYSEVEDYVTWATKPFDKMNDVNGKYPDKFMMGTEACNGFIPIIDQGPKLGDWNRGERYGFDIMSDLNAWAVGWTDWNIALDLSGGPNWAKNVVDAPILIDTEAGDVFYKNPMFYYLGHFSKFIKPGSVRIGVESTGNLISAPMEAAGFLTPDGEVVVVVMNRDIAGHKYNIELPGKGFINVDVPKHSIQTFIFEQ
ncbi:hypothetical protein TL16_g07301 [Triparma laevis f. inornata]|uniref:Glucosylceramidase n=1 Tax=Triparma laevis f. inornata TaxID=1714386 RepID=A0A9W7AY29_9STRA|nr:hypothetical protein TL16_g07301 [Triparma laevis f. inornata]